MAAPITIKKRKIGVKEKSAPSAKTDDTKQPTVAVDNESGSDEEADAAVFVSQPKPTGGHGGASSTAMTVAAVVALVATLIFLFLLLLQWTEWSELRPLFPRPVQIGMILASIPW